jgi:hypothetical protein
MEVFMNGMLVKMVYVFIWVWVGVTQAHAFYLQDPAGFSYPGYPAYPYVLSQPIDILPQGFITINVGDETYYYCKGIFYQKIMQVQKYVVVPPPIGAMVFNIPQGYQLILIDGAAYYESQGVYYKRTLEGYRVIYPPV